MTGPRLASGSGSTRTRSVLLLAGLVLAVAGAALPAAAAYIVGVVLLGLGLALAVRPHLPVALAVVAGVALVGAGVAVPLLARPHTSGLTGEWEAPAIDGDVLSGRALVSADNASVDLHTGKTVRLGSVTGGARWVADDRMLVVRDDRVDSVRLDATARWTWRPTGPRVIKPLAADQGMTVLRVCPRSEASAAGGACRLVGVDARGRAAWTTDAPGQQTGSSTVTGPAGSLPRVGVLPVPGSGGSFLVDPATGRRTLVADAATLALADGPVVVTTVSGGRCVTSLYAGLSPSWTSVSAQACPTALPSRWFTAEGHLWVERTGSWERYTLTGGVHAAVSAEEVPEPGSSGGWTVSEQRVSLWPNPFRGADRAFDLTLRDPASGEVVARLVTEHRADLLLAERGGVVVREDGRVTRYSLDHTRQDRPMSLDVAALRAHFPALAEGAAHFDGPGGSQVPDVVAAAVAETMTSAMANRGTVTRAERRAEQVVQDARSAMGDLLGTDPRGVVFGRSMTALTYDMARTLSRTWSPGDEVVVTRLDHDANIRPWVQAAERAGAVVRWADFDPATGELPPEAIGDLLSDRTRLVAVTAASNLIGTRPDIAAIADLVHGTPGLLYVDGVHYTPHVGVDVKALGADFFACSPYKFMGPHCGVVAASPQLLETLEPEKLLPSSNAVPERFELGTLPYELLAGTTAAVDFIAALSPLGDAGDRRTRVLSAMQSLEEHEDRLRERIEKGISALTGAVLYSRADRRTPTLLVRFEGHDSQDVRAALAERNVNAPAACFYAIEASRVLGLGDTGALRIGLAPYNDDEDADRLVQGLAEVVGG